VTTLLAAGAGIVGAVVGWFATGAVAAVVAGLLGMSDFEGERGMFAFFAIGPIGGLVGMTAASWAVLRVRRGRASAGATLGRLGVVFASIAGLVAAGIGLRFATLDTYTNEAPPTLLFELRLPDAIAPSERDDVRVELDTDVNVGDGLLGESRHEDGARVVSGLVPLARKTSSRLLVVRVRNQPTRLFRVALSRDPATTASFGEWRRPDFVDDGKSAQPVAAPKDDPVTLRVRVRRAGDD
jgi:hypothetical protein